MTAKSTTIYRGRYGPTPDRVIPWATLWRERTAAITALLRARLSALAAAPDRRAWSRENLCALEEAHRAVQFPIAVPRWMPAGYGLSALSCVSGGGGLLTLVFAANGGREFQISQRQRWLPLEEEMKAARVPVTRLRLLGRRLYVVHGTYGGEPIDHSFWPTTRRSVACEVGDVLVELREIAGGGPGLRDLLSVAASILPERNVSDARDSEGSAAGEMPGARKQ